MVRRQTIKGFHGGIHYKKKKWAFNMADHIDPKYNNHEGRDVVMKEIASWLYNNANGEAWFNGPLWTILSAFGVRVVHITPSNPLWNLLDHESRTRSPTRNYLMWTGHIWNDDEILITHFGPLGKGQEINMINEFGSLNARFLNDMVNRFPSRQDLDNMDKESRENTESAMKNHIEATYCRIHAKISDAISGVKRDLNDVIELIFGAVKEGVEVTASLAKSLAPTAAKLVLREISTIVLKQIAKEIAVIGSKQTGKSVAKKIPGVGLVVGAGLGLFRMAQGDPGRGLMEVASGAASCVPGGGTLASAAIDVAIAGIDVDEAITTHKARQSKFEGLRDRLDELLDQLEKLEKAYQVIKDLYGAFSFDDDAEDLLRALKIFEWLE